MAVPADNLPKARMWVVRTRLNLASLSTETNTTVKKHLFWRVVMVRWIIPN